MPTVIWLTIHVLAAVAEEDARPSGADTCASWLVGAPLTEGTDLDQTLTTERTPPVPANLSPEQERALVGQTLDDHYPRMLDEAIPALGGKSPRAAARTAKGGRK
jgi:hypothetical protein